MANATYEVLEIRIVTRDPKLTELFICCGPDSDGGILVQGWYKKTISADEVALDVLIEAFKNCNYLTEWDRGAPV